MKPLQPLSRWLAVRFALVAAFPLLVVGVLVWRVLLPEMHRDTELHYQALARAIAGQVHAHLSGARREIRAVREQLASEPVPSAPDHFRILDIHVAAGKVFEAIYLADPDDSIVSIGLAEGRRANREDLLGLNLSQRPFLRKARLTGEEEWSETFLSTVSGRLAVALAIPSGDHVLIGEITVDQLSEFVSDLPVEGGLFTAILDRGGRVIADSHRARGGQVMSFALRPPGSPADMDSVTVRELEIDGSPYIGALAEVPQVGWRVLAAQSHREAIRQITGTLELLGAGLVVALLVAVAAGWGLSRSISRKFGHYAEQARAIAHGDYGVPWPEPITLELAELATNLQRMSLAIRERELALAASEARYRSVVGNTPVVIFEIDHEGLFTLCEGLGLQTLGLKPGELVGTSLFDLLDHGAESTDSARRAMAGEAVQFTARMGEPVFEVYLNPVRKPGDETTTVIGVAVDITEREKREEELQQRTDELTRFVYTVSHDLKTPLVTIRSFVGFLEQDMARGDAARISQDMAYIRNAAEKMARLLDDLLDLAKVGRQVSPPEEMTLRELIQEAMDLLAGEITSREVAVRVTEEPVLIRGDRRRLVEVFQNLLDNALKFTRNQPSPEIEVGVETSGEPLVFFVRDNGSGIEPRFHDKIFDLFERLEVREEGSGVGLALVKRIVEVHGGRIWVESSGAGRGAVFKFTLGEAERSAGC